MLSKPKYGWSEIWIGGFRSRISYLTDVPFDCFEAAIASLKTGEPLKVSFDAEGWEFDVVSDEVCTYINLNDVNGDEIVYKENINRYEFINAIVDDIDLNISEWASWSYDDKILDENIESLKNLIKEVRELLKNNSIENKKSRIAFK